MSTDQPTPPGSGEGPFAKRPQDGGGPGSPGGPPPGQQPPEQPSEPPPAPPPGAAGPYGQVPPGTPPGGGGPYDGGQGPYQGGGPYGGEPPYGEPPYGGGPYGGDPLAGMPPLADSGKRLLARIIDIVIVAIPVILISWTFGGWQANPNDMTAGRSFLQSAVAAVFYVGYDWWMTHATGQTFGKRWMNLRVARLQDGSVPDSATSLIRAAVLWLPAVFCCACIWTAVCGGWSLFDKPYKQGIHDKAAKTVVVTA